MLQVVPRYGRIYQNTLNFRDGELLPTSNNFLVIARLLLYKFISPSNCQIHRCLGDLCLKKRTILRLNAFGSRNAEGCGGRMGTWVLDRNLDLCDRSYWKEDKASQAIVESMTPCRAWGQSKFAELERSFLFHPFWLDWFLLGLFGLITARPRRTPPLKFATPGLTYTSCPPPNAKGLMNKNQDRSSHDHQCG